MLLKWQEFYKKKYAKLVEGMVRARPKYRERSAALWGP